MANIKPGVRVFQEIVNPLITVRNNVGLPPIIIGPNYFNMKEGAFSQQYVRLFDDMEEGDGGGIERQVKNDLWDELLLSTEIPASTDLNRLKFNASKSSLVLRDIYIQAKKDSVFIGDIPDSTTNPVDTIYGEPWEDTYPIAEVGGTQVLFVQGENIIEAGSPIGKWVRDNPSEVSLYLLITNKTTSQVFVSKVNTEAIASYSSGSVLHRDSEDLTAVRSSGSATATKEGDYRFLVNDEVPLDFSDDAGDEIYYTFVGKCTVTVSKPIVDTGILTMTLLAPGDDRLIVDVPPIGAGVIESTTEIYNSTDHRFGIKTGSTTITNLGITENQVESYRTGLDLTDQFALDVAADLVVAYMNTKLTADFLVTSLQQVVGTVNTNNDINNRISNNDIITPDNPLAFGCYSALLQTNATVFYLPLNEDSTSGYMEARDLLENEQRIYAIALLTQNTTVNQMYANHVTSMAKPDKSKFRVVFINEDSPTSDIIFNSSEHEPTQSAVSTALYGADDVQLTDSTASFITTLAVVPATDFVRIIETNDNLLAEIGLYSISLASTNTTLALDTKVEDPEGNVVVEQPDVTIGAQATGIVYRIERSFTGNKDAEAATIAARAKSYANKRVIYMSPDSFTTFVPTTSGGISIQAVPGYYLSCMYAGLTTERQPHQSFTFLPVAGVESLRNSNDYFSADQLDVIQGGGVFQIVQDLSSTTAYCRRQLTTGDQQILEEKEYSIVKTVDYCSFFLAGLLRGFIGRYNVTPQTLELISTTLTAGLKNLKGTRYPRLGAKILSGSLGAIETSPVSLDTINVTVTIEVAKPLNFIDLYIRV